MINNTENIVYVAMLVYNHEKFISRAIEGVVNQKTNFNYKVLISDDNSTDKTQEICKQYALKYPDKIELIFNKKNLGVHQNLQNLLNACKGKYIAFCEGDDYWTDLNKLQKQVSFLEKNPNYSLCFHRSSILYEKNNRVIPYNSSFTKNQEFDPLLAYQETMFQSASMVYRKDAIFFPTHYNEYVFPDSAIILSLAQNGKFYGFSDIMSVYRKHEGGLSMPSWKKAKEFIKMMDLIDIDFGEKVYEATKNRRYKRYKYMASIYADQLNFYFFLLSLLNCLKSNPKLFLKKDLYILLKKYIRTLLVNIKNKYICL